MARKAPNCDLAASLPTTDLTQSFATVPFRLENLDSFSITMRATAGTSGTAKLQSSNDMGQPVENPVIAADSWADVADSAATFPNATGFPLTWNHRAATFRWVRVVWTANGGSGVLESLRATGKGVG